MCHSLVSYQEEPLYLTVMSASEYFRRSLYVVANLLSGGKEMSQRAILYLVGIIILVIILYFQYQ